MERDKLTERQLVALLSQLTTLSEGGSLHWDRERGSAHRYARWKNNLLILGPAQPISETNIPRYLFITPFNSPSCLEINSDDEVLGSALMDLVQVVERVSGTEPPTDPFGVSADELQRLVS
ncbi:MAG TPA: hypothetical protein VGQ39_05625 [Pyrinomonadaceae bacterium]|jgi:hypothetical protein|nr:hypothetical protein [Pyrinomonadaceae bacterium]